MFSDPQNNIEQLGLSDHMVVADFGSGSGFYTIAAANAVAPSGKVYAVDVQGGLLQKFKREAHEKNVRNIDILMGDLEKIGGSRIRETSCDAVIASNVLFMVEDKKTFLSEAKRILKPGGRFLLIDWSGSFSQMGPHHDHVLYKDDAVKIVTSAGFVFDREIHAGAHHYGMIFRKQ